MDWQARSTAMRLLEQAVSTLTLGPSRSKNQLTLFASMLVAVPVARYLACILSTLLARQISTSAGRSFGVGLF